MSKLINNTKIPLSMAVWLANNSYDFKANPKSLSATDFTKSTRQLVLRNRNNNLDTLNKEEIDISSLVKSKMGTAVHDSIERVWLDESSRKNALQKLGYPPSVINRIVVNPNPKLVTENDIPVYMEIRNSINLPNGYTISGKFDFVAEGKLTDFKTTGTWKWNKLTEADKDYRIQGSIYKLIHSDIITEDTLDIVFLFTDWSANKALASKDYPQAPCVTHKVNLLSKEDTSRFLLNFTDTLERYKDTPESELPKCTPEQLWQDAPVFKYYKNPQKTARATKVFDNLADARKHLLNEGSVGIIKTIYGEAKACKYCPAFNFCTQKDDLIAEGNLSL